MRRLPGRGVGFVAVNDVELGDVCTFGSGGTPPRSTPEYFQGETPWITGADIGERSLISPRSFTTQEAISRSAVTVVPQGTALLVTRTSVGKVALSDRSLALSQDITSISPDSSMLDPAYLVAFLASYAPKLAREARGATIQGVTRSDVARISIPLPPLPEQRRIASILEQADNLRAKRQQSIAIVDELIDAAFHSTFDVSLSVNSSISSVCSLKCPERSELVLLAASYCTQNSQKAVLPFWVSSVRFKTSSAGKRLALFQLKSLISFADTKCTRATF